MRAGRTEHRYTILPTDVTLNNKCFFIGAVAMGGEEVDQQPGRVRTQKSFVNSFVNVSAENLDRGNRSEGLVEVNLHAAAVLE